MTNFNPSGNCPILNGHCHSHDLKIRRNNEIVSNRRSGPWNTNNPVVLGPDLNPIEGHFMIFTSSTVYIRDMAIIAYYFNEGFADKPETLRLTKVNRHDFHTRKGINRSYFFFGNGYTGRYIQSNIA